MLETITNGLHEPRRGEIAFETNLKLNHQRAFWNGVKSGFNLGFAELQTIPIARFNDWMTGYHMGRVRDRLLQAKPIVIKDIAELEALVSQASLNNNTQEYLLLKEKLNVSLPRIVKLNQLLYMTIQAQSYCKSRINIDVRLSPAHLVSMKQPLRTKADDYFKLGESKGFDYLRLNFLHQSISCNSKLVEQAIYWGINEWSLGLAKTDDGYQNKVEQKVQKRAERIIQHYLPMLCSNEQDVAQMLDDIQLTERTRG